MDDLEKKFKIFAKTLNNVLYDSNLAADYIDYLEEKISTIVSEKKHFVDLLNASLDREVRLLKELGRDPGDY